MAQSSDFHRSVFINCPFDAGYKPMFEAIVFAVMECGFIPRCALEISNSAQARIDKIFDIIAGCKLAVHDISNTELDSANDLPRFNMPFELGLFLGCKRYGVKAQKSKSCLILDREDFRYQKFLSDIGGQDIASHEASIDKMIPKIRDWLQGYTTAMPFPGGAAICQKHRVFRGQLPKICAALSLQEANLTFQDLTQTIYVHLTTPPLGIPRGNKPTVQRKGRAASPSKI